LTTATSKPESTDVMPRCGTSGLLKGLFTPLEPRIFSVQHPAAAKGPLTWEDMAEREYVSVDPG
jgi:hypothetical protein